MYDSIDFEYSKIRWLTSFWIFEILQSNFLIFHLTVHCVLMQLNLVFVW